jgi:hypothetical protein
VRCSWNGYRLCSWNWIHSDLTSEANVLLHHEVEEPARESCEFVEATQSIHQPMLELTGAVDTYKSFVDLQGVLNLAELAQRRGCFSLVTQVTS